MIVIFDRSKQFFVNPTLLCTVSAIADQVQDYLDHNEDTVQRQRHIPEIVVKNLRNTVRHRDDR